MKIITISGLDGSGKSTQVNLIKDHLESQGKRVFYFHAVDFSIGNFCARTKKNDSYNTISRPTESVIEINNGKSVTEASQFKIFLRKIALKIDLIRFNKLIAKLEKEGYDYLISDRYFYDIVVNIEYLKNNILPLEKGDVRRTEGFLESNEKLKSPLIPLLQRGRIIKPNLAIYLQTSPDLIMSHERKPDQGLEYLQKKKEIYDKYSGIWNLKIIDGNRSKEEIFEEIINYVK